MAFDDEEQVVDVEVEMEIAEHMERLREACEKDTAKTAALNVLVDGSWHSTMELWRRIKAARKTVGLVGVGRIMEQFQLIAGRDFVQKKAGLELSEWRVNPMWLNRLRQVVSTLNSSQRLRVNYPVTKTRQTFSARHGKPAFKPSRKDGSSLPGVGR